MARNAAQAGKRTDRKQNVNAVSGKSGGLLFVHDSFNNVKWLVDSGALYSIVPPSLSQRVQGPKGQPLQAANALWFVRCATLRIHVSLDILSSSLEPSGYIMMD